jgi:hypothetical protein
MLKPKDGKHTPAPAWMAPLVRIFAILVGGVGLLMFIAGRRKGRLYTGI